ncbi:MAG: hypothetical protein ACRYFS_24510 [Janthinobacterium lividum]
MRVSSAKVVKRLSDYFWFRVGRQHTVKISNVYVYSDGSRFEVCDFPHDSAESKGYYIVINKADFTHESVFLGECLADALASLDALFLCDTDTSETSED